MTSIVTDRIYAAAQTAFKTWCKERGIREPVYAQIAQYLRSCNKQRGPSTVPVHLSAVCALYRKRGKPLDSKNTSIQRVVSRARESMRSCL